MNTEQKEFIVSLSKLSEGDQIQNLFPELFESYWLLDDRFEKWMVYIKDGKILYGIDATGDWFNNRNKKVNIYSLSCEHEYRASHDEVKARLFNYAERADYKTKSFTYVGGRILNSSHEKINLEGFMYDPKSNAYFGSGSLSCPKDFLMKDGVWAKTKKIKTMTLAEAEKKLGCKIK